MKKIVSSFVVSIALASTLSAADYYATVNGEKITKADVAMAVQDPRIDFKKLPKKAQKQVLDQIIAKKLIAKQALSNGISSNKDYKNTLAKMKQDLAFEVWQQQELKKINISDSAKRNFYNKNKSKFVKPAMLSARHILVKTKSEAQNIINKLNKASNKEATFISLAKSKSIGPTGAKGGNLGTFPENQMVPEFSKAAKKLSKNSYTKTPVKTQFGYHVIYLKDKKSPEQLSYSKVKNNIGQMLKAKKYGQVVKSLSDKLRKKAKIVIK